MLVLARRVGEEIFIGDDIRIKILEAGYGKCRVGIEAPPQVSVIRGEVSEGRGGDREVIRIVDLMRPQIFDPAA